MWVIAFGLTIHLAHADEPASSDGADVFSDVLQPLFQKRCVKCHGKDTELEGEVDLFALRRRDDLSSQPQLIEIIIEALDSGIMPPEDEPPLDTEQRESLIEHLQTLLRGAVRAQQEIPRTPLRRMNRFYYNNAVQDLFQLDVEVFSLPERMLREHGNYFQPHTGKMPAKLTAGSRPLGKSQLIEPRLGGVTAFPQDLRAEHGFDNQADHLSMSPLLLEAFMKLGRSIVESPDFNERNCGIWPTFFAPPKETEKAKLETIVRQRLEAFLTRAFRRPAEEELLDRYTSFVQQEIESGASFADSMKAAAAAAIASPRFLYLYEVAASDADDNSRDDYALASRLSFFLWASIPDRELLALAAQGRLHEHEVLAEQVARMLGDHRLKRFCDSFPAQWLQLERIISSTPDPQKYPQFYHTNEKYRASMHMMLEPLLLFEAVLIENQSILQLVDSDFSYRSDMLKAWYRDGTTGKIGPPTTITFHRVPIDDRRQGGVITNAAVMTMTSGTTRTKPITRGAWVAGVILNNPPEPPPADVPPLADQAGDLEENLTLRERFAAHRKQAACAGCHKRIDPLGFALENYDAAGIWRDTYENGRRVDASGTLFGKHRFEDVVEFKKALLLEKNRFTRAFAAHLLSYALGREVTVADSLALDKIVQQTADDDYRIQTLIRQVVLSEPFRR